MDGAPEERIGLRAMYEATGCLGLWATPGLGVRACFIFNIFWEIF